MTLTEHKVKKLQRAVQYSTNSTPHYSAMTQKPKTAIETPYGDMLYQLDVKYMKANVNALELKGEKQICLLGGTQRPDQWASIIGCF